MSDPRFDTSRFKKLAVGGDDSAEGLDTGSDAESLGTGSEEDNSNQSDSASKDSQYEDDTDDEAASGPHGEEHDNDREAGKSNRNKKKLTPLSPDELKAHNEKERTK